MKLAAATFKTGRVNDPSQFLQLIAQPLKPDTPAVLAFIQQSLGYTSDAAKALVS